jgi:hypothetical protein
MVVAVALAILRQLVVVVVAEYYLLVGMVIPILQV